MEGNVFYSNLWPLTLPVHQDFTDTNFFSFDHDADAKTLELKNTYQGIMLWYSGQIEDGTVTWNATRALNIFYILKLSDRFLLLYI